MKIVGEILSPCWTPDETGNQLVCIPFNFTHDVVSKNMALMELKNLPSIPLLINLYINASLSAKWKAFCKSINVENVLCLFNILFLITVQAVNI